MSVGSVSANASNVVYVNDNQASQTSESGQETGRPSGTRPGGGPGGPGGPRGAHGPRGGKQPEKSAETEDSDSTDILTLLETIEASEAEAAESTDATASSEEAQATRGAHRHQRGEGGPPSTEDLLSHIDDRLQDIGVGSETRAAISEQLQSALSDLTDDGSQPGGKQIREALDSVFKQNGVDASQLRRGAIFDKAA